MTPLHLVTSLAGAIAGGCVAHHLGHPADLALLLAGGGWDWEALALTAGAGVAALELAIGMFGECDGPVSRRAG
jgi:hypothetical protein